MPAIDLARLKTQAIQLADLFEQPEAFVQRLDGTLALYTNRTVRSTQAALRASLPGYQTPRPVLRQIQNELAPLALQKPEAALSLVVALWKSATIETRLLAACLLGHIPPASALSLLTRLPDWLQETRDGEILQALLTDALRGLRAANQEAFLSLLEAWLKEHSHKTRNWGLMALPPLLRSPSFENLPAVFRLLRPAIEQVSAATQVNLRACLEALGSVSAVETAHYLNEIATAQPNPQMLRILRRILPSLHPEIQAGLKDALRTLV
ncbi:MAG: hypothetical protein FJZ96_11235 [Chloroflexi bacterium]|nr:hypothetical protein [Chloroflexota bacterium]